MVALCYWDVLVAAKYAYLSWVSGIFCSLGLIVSHVLVLYVYAIVAVLRTLSLLGWSCMMTFNWRAAFIFIFLFFFIFDLGALPFHESFL